MINVATFTRTFFIFQVFIFATSWYFFHFRDVFIQCYIKIIIFPFLTNVPRHPIFFIWLIAFPRFKCVISVIKSFMIKVLVICFFTADSIQCFINSRPFLTDILRFFVCFFSWEWLRKDYPIKSILTTSRFIQFIRIPSLNIGFMCFINIINSFGANLIVLCPFTTDLLQCFVDFTIFLFIPPIRFVINVFYAHVLIMINVATFTRTFFIFQVFIFATSWCFFHFRDVFI